MNKVAPDSLPQRGDRYEAFGLGQKIKPIMLTFVLSGWSMDSLCYDDIESMSFEPLEDARDRQGECIITLVFGKKLGVCVIVVITGRNLYNCFDYLGYHRVDWIWELPKDRAAAAEAAPVVHSIDIKEASPQDLVVRGLA